MIVVRKSNHLLLCLLVTSSNANKYSTTESGTNDADRHYEVYLHELATWPCVRSVLIVLIGEISSTDSSFISPSVDRPEDNPHSSSGYVEKWGCLPYTLHNTSLAAYVKECKDGSEYANAVEDEALDEPSVESVSHVEELLLSFNLLTARARDHWDGRIAILVVQLCEAVAFIWVLKCVGVEEVGEYTVVEYLDDARNSAWITDWFFLSEFICD